LVAGAWAFFRIEENVSGGWVRYDQETVVGGAVQPRFYLRRNIDHNVGFRNANGHVHGYRISRSWIARASYGGFVPGAVRRVNIHGAGLPDRTDEQS
jgi:hypothetical protein